MASKATKLSSEVQAEKCVQSGRGSYFLNNLGYLNRSCMTSARIRNHKKNIHWKNPGRRHILVQYESSSYEVRHAWYEKNSTQRAITVHARDAAMISQQKSYLSGKSCCPIYSSGKISGLKILFRALARQKPRAYFSHGIQLSFSLPVKARYELHPALHIANKSLVSFGWGHSFASDRGHFCGRLSDTHADSIFRTILGTQWGTACLYRCWGPPFFSRHWTLTLSNGCSLLG